MPNDMMMWTASRPVTTLEHRQDVDADCATIANRKPQRMRFVAVRARVLVVDQVAHFPWLEPEPLGRERQQHDYRQDEPGADLRFLCRDMLAPPDI